MPAETHQHGEPVDEEQVLALIWEVTANSDTPGGPDPDLPVAAIGLDDELALLDLWDAIVEELAERASGHVDLDALRDALTLAQLAQVIVQALDRA